MTNPTPGWYADPQNERSYRWWDGSTWTSDTSDTGEGTPGVSAMAAPPGPPSPGAVPLPTPTAGGPTSMSAAMPTSMPTSGGSNAPGTYAAPPLRKASSKPTGLIVGGVVAVVAVVAIAIAIASSGGDKGKGGGGGNAATSGTGTFELAVSQKSTTVHDIDLAPGELVFVKVVGAGASNVSVATGVDRSTADRLGKMTGLFDRATLATGSDDTGDAFLAGDPALAEQFASAQPVDGSKPVPGYGGLLVEDITTQIGTGYADMLPVSGTASIIFVANTPGTQNVTLKVCTRKDPSVTGDLSAEEFSAKVTTDTTFLEQAHQECTQEAG